MQQQLCQSKFDRKLYSLHSRLSHQSTQVCINVNYTLVFSLYSICIKLILSDAKQNYCRRRSIFVILLFSENNLRYIFLLIVPKRLFYCSSALLCVCGLICGVCSVLICYLLLFSLLCWFLGRAVLCDSGIFWVSALILLKHQGNHLSSKPEMILHVNHLPKVW